MSLDMSEDHWFWVGKGIPDEKRDRRRVFYKSVGLKHPDGRKRQFKVGDTVNMAGDEAIWVAQIIELFQVNAHDPELRHILRTDSLKNESKHHYELKRCTLRWFYNPSDMDWTTLKNCRWPKRLNDEIWFSDHIEKPGYNSVQVIDGRAWLFDNMLEKNEFLANVPEEYDEERDIIRIVRGFVDSKLEDLPARLLFDDELKWLQANPSDDPKLYYNSKRRFENITPSPSKRKRRNHLHSSLREPVNVAEDEFDPVDIKRKNDKRKHRSPHTNQGVQEVSKVRRAVRKRKIMIDDDDESLAKQDNDEESDDVPLSQLRPTRPESKPSDHQASIDLLNDEVRDLVESLNASAFADDAPRPSSRPSEKLDTETPKNAEEDEITPDPAAIKPERKSLARPRAKHVVSSKSKKSASKPSTSTKASDAIIIIDSDDEERAPKAQPQPTSPKLHRVHLGAANRAYRGGRHGKPSMRNRSSFMPTSRERTGISFKKQQKNASRDDSKKTPSVVSIDTASKGRLLPKQRESLVSGVHGQSSPKEDVRMKDSRSISPAMKNGTAGDSDDVSPLNDSSIGVEGRGARQLSGKRLSGDDSGQHQNDAQRRALGAVGKKPKALALPPDLVQPVGNFTETKKGGVGTLTIDGKYENRAQGKPGAKKMGSENVIDVNDSDTEPDDRGLQDEGSSAVKLTQAQRKLAEDVYRIHGCMTDVDKTFVCEKLEWLIDDIVLFHEGRKGSLNAEEYARVLKDQLLEKRQREIGTLGDAPAFKSHPHPRARERD
ncbi:unnamed protein product [Agarophyton chilense]|eukprot:gb/GEZJ01003230.1/.p1 GENE.gb/GEZJ01003230.1/~~gb/GEZJ01003230.1/.p1  ORF type:complete len:773 (+),score=131.13 gb/GEZJ01003230.1/:399-2717(+)